MNRYRWLNHIWETNDEERTFFTWSQMDPDVHPDTIKELHGETIGEAYEDYLERKGNE